MTVQRPTSTPLGAVMCGGWGGLGVRGYGRRVGA